MQTHTQHAPLGATSHSSSRRPRRGVALAVTATFLATGCASMGPDYVTPAQMFEAVKPDRVVAQQDVPQITGPVTLDEAVARALKYNLDRRVRSIEEAVALGTFEAGKFDMLPKLVAQAGWQNRDKELISRSKDSVTGAPSLANPFISSDKTHQTQDLGLTWSLLDFGTSYFTAKQNADRVLVAAERRRKAMHTLMQDVRSAFWRTASAQRLRDDVAKGIALAEEALADARKAEAERVRTPLDSLRYQRQVLENLRLLETAQQELSTARVELAQLINAPLALDLKVVEPAGGPGRKVLDLPIDRLEEVAVSRNADVRESFYNARIATEETRKVITKLFPNLSFNYNVKYDSNSYLINSSWNEAGLSLSYNLLNLLSGPQQLRLAEAGVALADQRRVAMQMATLTQLHIARLQYSNALVQLGRAEAIASIDNRISEITNSREQAQVQSKLEAVANRATTILSQMRRYQALAQAHTAASKLQATLGLEPEFESLQDIELPKLVQAVGASHRAWDEARMPSLVAPAAAQSR